MRPERAARLILNCIQNGPLGRVPEESLVAGRLEGRGRRILGSETRFALLRDAGLCHS